MLTREDMSTRYQGVIGGNRNKDKLKGNTKEMVNEEEFYHPTTNTVILPLLSKIYQLSLAVFLWEEGVSYKDTADPNILDRCQQMIVFGRCWEGCYRDHTNVLDLHTRHIYQKLNPAQGATLVKIK